VHFGLAALLYIAKYHVDGPHIEKYNILTDHGETTEPLSAFQKYAINAKNKTKNISGLGARHPLRLK
jgi:hypothetical protein